MDDLLREFLSETNESLGRIDAELVRFEREPNNGQIVGNIFRLVHSIKGTTSIECSTCAAGRRLREKKREWCMRLGAPEYRVGFTRKAWSKKP